MPKLPRDLSPQKVCKALERAGFHFAHGRKHFFYVKEGKGVTVPLHGKIKPGTLRAILREAGISLEEFLDCL